MKGPYEGKKNEEKRAYEGQNEGNRPSKTILLSKYQKSA
jgi:hypothetical protein